MNNVSSFTPSSPPPSPSPFSTPLTRTLERVKPLAEQAVGGAVSGAVGAGMFNAARTGYIEIMTGATLADVCKLPVKDLAFRGVVPNMIGMSGQMVGRFPVLYSMEALAEKLGGSPSDKQNIGQRMAIGFVAGAVGDSLFQHIPQTVNIGRIKEIPEYQVPFSTLLKSTDKAGLFSRGLLASLGRNGVGLAMANGPGCAAADYFGCNDPVRKFPFMMAAAGTGLILTIPLETWFSNRVVDPKTDSATFRQKIFPEFKPESKQLGHVLKASAQWAKHMYAPFPVKVIFIGGTNTVGFAGKELVENWDSQKILGQVKALCGGNFSSET